ncbi:hypothetical protein MAM1_0226d08345 [Mucor ambiguus]|uniref:Uncharacterized protein n=1 Tax=Mucor ambiguus TaxID=91626 RepID=A0A0C9N2L3_9FUNG|nr:hypothetical protein MAM1_0226d08345 [Mucor ambiguus]
MFNPSTLPPNTPPIMPRSQKEQDAASSLVELQQSFSNTIQPNNGMNSPASSPTKSNPPATATAHHIRTRQQPRGASASISPSSQQAHYELLLLPSIYRQRESAVRSTLSRSLPVFGTLICKEDEEVRQQSTIQSNYHLQQGQVYLPPRKQLKLPQAQYHSIHLIHRPEQAQSSQARPTQPPVTPAQAVAHAQAQAYYLAHARVQTYGHSQQHHQHRSSQINNQQQSDNRPQQLHQNQQPIMNHHVRAVENHSSSQPWPEPNSNRSSKPARANDPTHKQNSFSIRGNGVYTQRNILHEGQQPATPIPSCQPQVYGKTSSQQQQMAHLEQQQTTVFHSREARLQATQRSLDPQGMSRRKMSSVVFYHPNTTIAQQVYDHRETIQRQSYRHHQQAHGKAVYRVNQHFKQQQQQHYPSHHHQQSMHQSKETSRRNRDLMAQHEALPHCQPSTQSQPQPQQQCAITISLPTTPETVLANEADEDEKMDELEEYEEEDEESFEEDDNSDPDFHGASKTKRHRGHSSSSGSSNHHHHGNNNSGSSSSNNNKKGKSAKEKPRWTAEMRESLLKAVITYKNLDDMTSFHWSQIGKQVGRSGKACKDQWRRALLPKIQQTFDHCDQDFNTGTSGASSFPASLQPQQQRNNRQ